MMMLVKVSHGIVSAGACLRAAVVWGVGDTLL